MKRIEDERLKLKNLNNIRIAYIVQTLGIIAILGYDLVKKGLDGMTQNPLWFVLMVTSVIFLYLSMSISVDHETGAKSPKRGLGISLVVLTVVSAVIGILVSITHGLAALDGVITGGILFVCGLMPIFYIYYLRKRRPENGDI